MSAETHPDIRRTLLFLVNEDDMILLAMKKRGFGAGLLNGVGGKVEEGESLEQALVRECQEEIGVTPTKWEKIAELNFIQDSTTEPWQMHVHAYLSNEWDGEPKETEEMKPAWYDLHHIPYSQMWDDDKYWLPLALKKDKLYGEFTFDENNKVLKHTIRPTKDF